MNEGVDVGRLEIKTDYRCKKLKPSGDSIFVGLFFD